MYDDSHRQPRSMCSKYYYDTFEAETCSEKKKERESERASEQVSIL